MSSITYIDIAAFAAKAKKKKTANTYCKRGEGHTHAPEAVESQGDEDKDREFWEGHTLGQVCQ